MNSAEPSPRFEAHYNLGNLYFDANDFRLAQLHYELAAEIDPAFANVFFNLSLVRAISGDTIGAVDSLTKYRRLVPEDEGRNAEELLNNLKRSLGRNSRIS